VYSANERWSDADIVDTCALGHRVAVVFDVPKGGLPTTWNGVPVLNGDKTDDLWEHKPGHIVGLAVKGHLIETRRTMAERGFARAA
jgi:hypothetical protein